MPLAKANTSMGKGIRVCRINRRIAARIAQRPQSSRYSPKKSQQRFEIVEKGFVE